MSDTAKNSISAIAKFQKRDLDLACAFADDNEDIFDGEFVYALRTKFNQFRYLTDKQYEALQNTIERWNMESWAAKNGVEFNVEGQHHGK